MSVQLGTLRKVSIRDVWKHEDGHFTPWLAEAENIRKLADAIGMPQLEVIGKEMPVGPFSADILAKSFDAYVLIENQYGKTNHDHLGKLITYSATLNAATLVWVAETFTDEHRKAIEWLNDHSSEDLSFFAVELELWQIDDSRPAVQFNVLSQPSELVREAIALKAGGPLSENRALQLDFWKDFRNLLISKRIVSSAQNPRPQNWFNVPLGRTDVFLSNVANFGDNLIGVRLYIRQRLVPELLPQLEAQRNQIEADIGLPLRWDPNPEHKDKVISLEREAELSEHSRWPEYLDWMCTQVATFKRVFEPRIRKPVAP